MAKNTKGKAEKATEEVEKAAQGAEEAAEKGIDRIAAELDLAVPKGKLPSLVKLVALATLAGGLSITGGSFVDILDPADFSISVRLLRLVVGLAFIAIAYGIFERRRWAVWLYGFVVVLIGLIFNFGPAVFIPAVAVVYLALNYKLFHESLFDKAIKKVWQTIQKTTEEITS